MTLTEKILSFLLQISWKKGFSHNFRQTFHASSEEDKVILRVRTFLITTVTVLDVILKQLKTQQKRNKIREENVSVLLPTRTHHFQDRQTSYFHRGSSTLTMKLRLFVFLCECLRRIDSESFSSVIFAISRVSFLVPLTIDCFIIKQKAKFLTQQPDDDDVWVVDHQMAQYKRKQTVLIADKKKKNCVFKKSENGFQKISNEQNQFVRLRSANFRSGTFANEIFW